MLKFKGIKTSTDSSDKELEFSIALTKEILTSYSRYEEIGKLVADRITTEVYPEIKGKLMASPEFDKIINEIRLQVGKKFLTN